MPVENNNDIYTNRLRILIVDDSEDDVFLLVRELKKGDYDFAYKRVDTAVSLSKALDDADWDVIISDYMMPSFNGLDALKILQKKRLDIPFILMSGKITEEMAVDVLKSGAQDFISKQNLSRLNTSISRELDEAKTRSEKRKAEEDMRASEIRYRMLFESSKDGILVVDAETGIVTDANPKFLELLGYNWEEVIEKGLWDIHPFTEVLREVSLSDLQSNESLRYDDISIETRDGKHLDMEFISNIYSISNKKVIQCSIHDITRRKQNEKAILDVNRELKVLSRCNRALVHATEEAQLLNEICKTIVETGQYKMAWVGFLMENNNKIVPVAYSGDEDGFLSSVSTGWDGGESPDTHIRQAVQTGEAQLSQDISADEIPADWKAEALKRGYASVIVLPLKENHKTFGVIHIYSSELNAFTGDEIVLLEELAGDLAFGITSLRTRKERDIAILGRQEYLDKLRKSLEDTVRTIASTVEMKDPYTAGHQKRVADLAVLIAKDMGLTEDQVTAIHFAGIIHDVGKIRIPAEILSKPGHLSDVEMSFIRIHPQAGYDILKDIEFPWPIAKIVYEHHERIDGSGYPRGLKGDEIMIEAQIICVADVVESMASHRPYRASLGLEMAIEEIETHKGTFYDPRVVDTCIKLIHEKSELLKGVLV